MEQELSGYDYQFLGGINHVYAFKTRSNAAYEVKFKPSDYLIDDPYVADLIFEMVIGLTKNPYKPKLPPADALMSATIAQIVAHFFSMGERVVIYICDNSDSKADSRHKLFSRWFERYKNNIFVKRDISLGIDEQGTAYSVELLSRLSNPYYLSICESFERTISGEK